MSIGWAVLYNFVCGWYIMIKYKSVKYLTIIPLWPKYMLICNLTAKESKGLLNVVQVGGQHFYRDLEGCQFIFSGSLPCNGRYFINIL